MSNTSGSTGAIGADSTGDILALIDDTPWFQTSEGRWSIAQYSTITFLLLALIVFVYRRLKNRPLEALRLQQQRESGIAQMDGTAAPRGIQVEMLPPPVIAPVASAAKTRQ